MVKQQNRKQLFPNHYQHLSVTLPFEYIFSTVLKKEQVDVSATHVKSTQRERKVSHIKYREEKYNPKKYQLCNTFLTKE